MEKFLKVIRGIDWDMLHRQKMELLNVIPYSDKESELHGIVHLIDSLQDTAFDLRMWKFPGMYEGECPKCGGRNYEFLKQDEGVDQYECYDCGKLFTIGEKK